MFGLTFEKLFLVAVVAGVVLGPQRLPVYAHQLARTVRALRDLLETTRGNAEREIGISLRDDAWESLDLRQYDPRRIVRDALHEPAEPASTTQDGLVTDEMRAEAQRVRPGQRYLVTGSAAHPRRVPIDSLPREDPRRLAAERPLREQDSVDAPAA